MNVMNSNKFLTRVHWRVVKVAIEGRLLAKRLKGRQHYRIFLRTGLKTATEQNT